jgi:hypothetical protein
MRAVVKVRAVNQLRFLAIPKALVEMIRSDYITEGNIKPWAVKTTQTLENDEMVDKIAHPTLYQQSRQVDGLQW